MIKEKMKNSKGISLVTLTVTVIVLLILTNVVVYTLQDNLKVENLQNMQNDIANLRDKVASYYAQNGKIPAKLKYTNIETIKQAGVISNVADTGNFYIIDLAALENLTLHYGKDFEKVKDLSESEAQNYTDIYIINETSQNIFYVAGIKVDEDIFYTDYTADDVDTALVELKYVDNVKIPDGFSYVSGTKATQIIIKEKGTSEEYRWVVVKEKIEKVPDNVTIAEGEEQDFIKSVNAYQGYYQSTTSNKVYYLPIEEKWSLVYDKEATYQDKNGDTAYIPAGFQVSETPGKNTIQEGLVVQNAATEDRYVWIQVPKSIYKTATAYDDYENIEKDMQTYTTAYRQEGYTDTWYSGCGIDSEEEYNKQKNNMLSSVYANGGFYIGQYEAGTETARFDAGATLTDPVSKQDAYPYNFVNCSQAQERATKMNSGGRTSSLMFGIQWDLVCKFIEEKGYLQNGTKVTKEMIDKSKDWGNFQNATFPVVRGQYTEHPTTFDSWQNANDYTKPTSDVILTTGATDRNSVLNIYDLAGNVWEWTLEHTTDDGRPSGSRGSCFNNDGLFYRSFFSCLWWDRLW